MSRLVALRSIYVVLAAVPIVRGATFIDLGRELVPNQSVRSSLEEFRVESLSGNGSVVAGSIHWDDSTLDCANIACSQFAFAFDVPQEKTVEIPSQDPLRENFRRRPPVSVTALSLDGEVAAVAFDQDDGWYLAESALLVRGTIQEIDTAGTDNGWFFATGMSEDASVVVGRQLERDSDGSPSKYSPEVWRKATGLRTISVSSPRMTLLPVDVSGDGKVILLSDQSAELGYQTNSHNASTVIGETRTELPPLDGSEYSSATSLSRDGSAVIGSSHSSSDKRSIATKWIDAQPTLLDTPDEFESNASDITADGTTIVGSWTPLGLDASQISFRRRAERVEAMRQSEAVVWQAGEAVLVEELLSIEYRLGDQLTGWSLTSATHLSADGRVIAGTGIDPNNNVTAWVAVLEIPEPTAVVMLIGLLSIAAMRPRRFQFSCVQF